MDKNKFFKFCFGCEPDLFPESVIMSPFIPARKFADNIELVSSFKGRLYSGIIASKAGKKFAAVHCGIGDRLLGDAVLLLGITKVSNILFTGSCGGFKDCNIGDLIICERAFDGEGFSRYHTTDFNMSDLIKKGDYSEADNEYTRSLKAFLDTRTAQKKNCKFGDIFTIGSVMAEKDENLKHISDVGFKGIEMELSAVFRASNVIKRKAAGIVFVSDLPIEKPIWEGLSPEGKKDYDNGFNDLMRFSVDFILN